MAQLITPIMCIGLSISELNDNYVTFSNNGILPMPRYNIKGNVLNNVVDKVSMDVCYPSKSIIFSISTAKKGKISFEISSGERFSPFANEILYSIN